MTTKSMWARSGHAASMARTWIAGASSARTSVKFILLMLAVLLPVGMMLVQLTPKAAQIDAVSISSFGNILFVGGETGSGSLASTELFDPVTSSFAPANQTPVMNSARVNGTATLLTVGPNAGKVLIAGGADQNDLYLASTDLYDPATNSFAPANETASMNTARINPTATTITIGPNAGKILIAGGFGTSLFALASTELYDPVTNSFAPANQTASMNTARFDASAAVIATGPNAGKILIAGGTGNSGTLTSTELYDPATNSFASSNQTASMNIARSLAVISVLRMGPNAGKILIAGGSNSVSGLPFYLRSTELYDPVTNTFAQPLQTASMNTGRVFATISTIPTGPNAGRILIAGGANATQFLASTDLYDPSTNTFAPPFQTAWMNTPYFDATATTLATGPNAGKILVAGGAVGGSGSGILASSDLYDPATNTFAPANQTPSMNVAREGALAVQLPVRPSPITFVGVGPLVDGHSPLSAVTLGVPVGIQSGDILLAQILVYDGAGTNVPTAPVGWSVIRHDAINASGNRMTSWLYYHVADAIEPVSYTWTIALQYAAGVMGAWRGASISSPIDKSSGTTAGGFNPITIAAPGLVPATDLELQVYFYGAQNFAAPTITEPDAITSRANDKSTKEGFTLALGDLAAPPGGTGSQLYSAMGSSTGGLPVMTAQAVLLVPLNAAPTPTPTPLNRTPTPTVQASPGPSPPPPTPTTPTATPTVAVRFVATGALTDSAQPLTAVTVSLPPNVVPGDLLVAQIALWDGTGSDVPTTPAGWNVIRHDAVSSLNKTTSWLYYHVAGAGEPGSYTWNISPQYAAGVMGAWRGASSSLPVDKASGSGGSGPSPVSVGAPSLTPATNLELQLYFYSSQSAAAPTIGEPGAITQRANLKSSKEGFTLAFGDLAAPSGGTASPTYIATASFSSGQPVLTAQAVLLRPGP